jgi:ribosomal protein L18
LRPERLTAADGKEPHVPDDAEGRTLVAASSLDKDLKGDLKKGSDQPAAEAVGKLVAERAEKAGATVWEASEAVATRHTSMRPERKPTAMSRASGVIAALTDDNE